MLLNKFKSRVFEELIVALLNNKQFVWNSSELAAFMNGEPASQIAKRGHCSAAQIRSEVTQFQEYVMETISHLSPISQSHMDDMTEYTKLSSIVAQLVSDRLAVDCGLTHTIRCILRDKFRAEVLILDDGLTYKARIGDKVIHTLHAMDNSPIHTMRLEMEMYAQVLTYLPRYSKEYKECMK